MTVTIDGSLLKWVKANVGIGRRFSSVSNAFEFAVARLRQGDRHK